MRKKLLILLSLLPIHVNANSIGGGDILGRDLDIPGMGWLGHVGIAYGGNYPSSASQVIEVLNENAVIQINTIENFKSKSKYWGSRWIIAGVTQVRDVTSVLNEGVTQKAFCPIYTSTAQYKAGTPNSCGIFRCDTFVYHIFNAGSGCKIIKDGGVMLPTSVYNAFPYSNGDEPPKIKTNPNIDWDTMTIQKLSNMKPDAFMEIINAPIDKITDKEIRSTWKFSQDTSLSSEKRTLLIDKLGFIGKIEMIPDFVEKYFTIDDNQVKSMLLRSTLTIYQKYPELEQYPKEKEILQTFYRKLLDSPLSNNDASIVIRGFTQLSASNVILANIEKINAIFQSQKVNLDPYVSVGLKIELAFKSKDLEKIYIPDIISNLNKEGNLQIENLFNQWIVRKLSEEGINALDWQSKNAISLYLNSVQYKYAQPDQEKNEDTMLPLFYGAWLEASALTKAHSLEDAGKYIARFLQDKPFSEQTIYINGLSHSNYMKKAFNTYPIFINFNNKNKNSYRQSMETPWWCKPKL